MEDFDFEKQISGFACCPDCGFVWPTVVPYGQFFTLTCPKCGRLVRELNEAHLC
jgi:predicted  nucleic acid-binding Zn ribbon protein